MRFFISLLVFLVACGSVSADTLTYADLVSRLTDMEHLGELPVAGERCEQASSYDRASKYDAASGKYVGWDANGDGTGFIRTEGNQQVLAEMQGPGCIWRIWSAAPGNGHVRIYLDGAAEPAVDLPFSQYFDCLHEPFVYPSLVHDASSGKNSYVPIPYQKSCKVVADNDWGNYYQFTYSSFPRNTIIPTFSMNLSAADRFILRKADTVLTRGLGSDPAGERVNSVTETNQIYVPAGGTAVVRRLIGTGAIAAIRIPAGMKNYPSDMYRSLVLRIYWDGAKKPDVEVPLGDFFGTGPGLNKYQSLPMGVSDDGLYSFWFMPYSNGAVIELANESTTEYSAHVEVTTVPLYRPASLYGRFHAKWHRDAYLPKEPERQIDWPMLIARGRGRFCGVALEVWNPRGGWWGEGDEKFFVDGEKFPSTFGTGSEDYFGYAWCNPTLFQNCYHNQTLNGGNNFGHVSVNRWHIADNVPFQKSFEADIEKYFGNDRPTHYACTVYWYSEPGQVDSYRIPSAQNRLNWYSDPEMFRARGALEGENLQVTGCTGGTTQSQSMYAYGNGWSSNEQLWWTGAKPGDRLSLAVQVDNSGKYDINVQLTKAIDYGICQFYIDGRKVGTAVDLFNNGVSKTGEISLGEISLTKGQHDLSIEIIGANDSAVKSYMFGLDYIKLVEIK